LPEVNAEHCYRKAYSTLENAQEAMDAGVDPYYRGFIGRCRYCGWWHIADC
jgi:hypothetical protein